MAPMPVVKVLAALAVADIEAARAWYEQLLGRPADDIPMATAAEWHLTETGSIQLVQSAERAGKGLVTLTVDDVDDLVVDLAGRDLELAAADTPSGMFRIASTTDPEGNVITFAEDLRRT
jgi:catechol 2,3-dioxygenase-like lactoylglutathione lyase family enzyme